MNVAVMLVLIMGTGFASGLDPNFYSRSCPNVVQIVATIVNRHLKQDVTIAAPLVRLFFHDCFVEGCDASVLIVSPNKTAERDATPNFSLSQFDLIDEIKSALERTCPGTVSCADILALAARDAVLQTGGPTWAVELGRRDGLKSSDFDATTHLPSSRSDAQALINSFASNRLSIRDLVTLSGAHTFGKTHCSFVGRRLYDFTNNGGIDPTLNTTYAMSLKKQCTAPVNPNTIVLLDPSTPNRFDNIYFKELLQNQGIFSSDSALVLDPRTKVFVTEYANNEDSFRDQFGIAMIKMGRIGVLTGQQGQIRKRCDIVNTLF
ncbi:peroxidase 56 isoform X2 [Cryptomeria japonica]|nr:peroxidase 56 isoform X2 [Cryptomeria japonica]